MCVRLCVCLCVADVLSPSRIELANTYAEALAYESVRSVVDLYALTAPLQGVAGQVALTL